MSNKIFIGLILSFVAGGVAAITKEWILGGMQLTPKEMTTRTLEIMDLLIKE